MEERQRETTRWVSHCLMGSLFNRVPYLHGGRYPPPLTSHIDCLMGCRVCIHSFCCAGGGGGGGGGQQGRKSIRRRRDVAEADVI